MFISYGGNMSKYMFTWNKFRYYHGQHINYFVLLNAT